MRIIMAEQSNSAFRVTCETENNVYFAKVYENIGGFWRQAHVSNPYTIKEKVEKAYKHFLYRYLR